MHGRTVGIVGTGKIGAVVARILTGFGCRILAYDLGVNPECVDLGVQYQSLEDVWAQSDIVSLHARSPPYKNIVYAAARRSETRRTDRTQAGLSLTQGVSRPESGQVGYLGLAERKKSNCFSRSSHSSDDVSRG